MGDLVTTGNRNLSLTFHGIGSPPTTTPADEIKYWIAESAFIEIIGRLAESVQEHDVQLTVTFDDGNKSDILFGAPVLREHNLKGIFFPCAGRLGQPGYLSNQDLHALIDAGFEIGSHGVDHLPWATLKGEALSQETAGSKEILEAATGCSIHTAALPFGSYNRRALTAARNAGYTQVFSSDPGLSIANSWFVRRFSYQRGIDFDLSTLVADYSRPSRRTFGAIKFLIKSMR